MNEVNTLKIVRRIAVAVIAILVGIIVLTAVGCEKLQEEYILRDLKFRIRVIEDSRVYHVWLTTDSVMTHPDPGIRRSAAEAMGRIGHPGYIAPLISHLADTSAEAAEMKFFAAGLIGDTVFIDPILGLLRDGTPAPGAAIEALGRIGDSTLADEIVPYITDDDSLVAAAAMMALWRSEGWSASDSMVAVAMTTANRHVKWHGLYALARGNRLEGKALYLSLLSDPDPEFRIWAYLGLGRSGDTLSIDRIATGLNDADDRVVAAAMTALAGFEELGSRLIADKLPGIEDEKLTSLALSILAEYPVDGVFEKVRTRFIDDGRENTRAEAARTLLITGQIQGLQVIDEYLPQPSAYQKQMIAGALAHLGPEAAIARLTPLYNDPAPIVRATALEALCTVDTAGVTSYLRRSLSDTDFVVVATAVNLAATYQQYSLIPLIAGMYTDTTIGINDDIKRSMIEAWAEFTEPTAHDSAMMRTLEDLSNDDWFLIRREAAELLVEKYAVDVRGEVGAARTGIDKRNFASKFEKYDVNPRAVIESERGIFICELFYDHAPKTVNNFIRLAERNFYDDRIFHRVIPNFVIQDGCPRGDGWGGPGYTIRSEFNRVPYTTGTLGMAHSGKDTGGSQYFFALSPQPHLNGRYTAFGRIISGMEIARAVTRGDSIISIRIEYGDRDE